MSSNKIPSQNKPTEIKQDAELSKDDELSVQEKPSNMLLSLDPGINFTGISVIDISEGFNVIETHYVKNNRAFTPEEKIIEKSQGPRAVKLLAIINKFKSLLERFKFDMIIIEAPFYNALTPQAYGSLLEVIFGLKYTLLVPLDLKYCLIEPTVVKKLFTSHGQAKKEMMKQFLESKLLSGEIVMDKSVDLLTEHEIDSIAIGYVYWLNNKQPKP